MKARETGPGVGMAPDVRSLQPRVANVVLGGRPGAADRDWVLIDAGLANSAGQITEVAAERFGKESRPHAILMTCGTSPASARWRSSAARGRSPSTPTSRSCPT